MKNTFKRGQLEWALWKYASFLQQGADSQPPKPFKTRIKRLLEIDRAGVNNSVGFAFSDVRPNGQGVDVHFSAFDAFCLALALELLDAGFKQSEVVFLLSHIRALLRTEYEYAKSRRLPDRQRDLSKNYPGWPSYQEDGELWVDFRVFAMIQKVELKEISPNLVISEGPSFIKPTFCRGIEALQEVMNRWEWFYRKVMILEISQAAAFVTHFIEEAPYTTRGRG